MIPHRAAPLSPEGATSIIPGLRRAQRAAPAMNPLLAPWPMPVVIVDTNVLLSSACHVAAHGAPPVLASLGLTGRAPLFIAPHVLDEFGKHLPRLAAHYGVTPAAARQALAEHLLPLLRVVDMTVSDHLRPEVAGIRAPEPAGDADDLPTAALAALLGPAVIISSDGVFARFGLAAVGEWITVAGKLLRAAGFEASFADAVVLLDVLARLCASGGRRTWEVIVRYPVPFVAAALTAVLTGPRLAQLGWVTRDRLRDVGQFGMFLLEQLATAAERHREARGELLLVQDPPWRRPTLTELCARQLARSRHPLTAAELREALSPPPPGVGRVTAAACTRAMTDHPAFARIPGGRFTLGRQASL